MEFFIIIAIIIAFFVIAAYNNLPEVKGRRAEKSISRILKAEIALGRSCYLLENLYIPKQTGDTAEIDMIYITVKGVFVIESKNYMGVYLR